MKAVYYVDCVHDKVIGTAAFFAFKLQTYSLIDDKSKTLKRDRAVHRISNIYVDFFLNITRDEIF